MTNNNQQLFEFLGISDKQLQVDSGIIKNTKSVDNDITLSEIVHFNGKNYTKEELRRIFNGYQIE
jgi:hypothetical protein